MPDCDISPLKAGMLAEIKCFLMFSLFAFILLQMLWPNSGECIELPTEVKCIEVDIQYLHWNAKELKFTVALVLVTTTHPFRICQLSLYYSLYLFANLVLFCAPHLYSKSIKIQHETIFFILNKIFIHCTPIKKNLAYNYS